MNPAFDITGFRLVFVDLYDDFFGVLGDLAICCDVHRPEIEIAVLIRCRDVGKKRVYFIDGF